MSVLSKESRRLICSSEKAGMDRLMIWMVFCTSKLFRNLGQSIFSYVHSKLYSIRYLFISPIAGATSGSCSSISDLRKSNLRDGTDSFSSQLSKDFVRFFRVLTSRRRRSYLHVITCFLSSQQGIVNTVPGQWFRKHFFCANSKPFPGDGVPGRFSACSGLFHCHG